MEIYQDFKPVEIKISSPHELEYFLRLIRLAIGHKEELHDGSITIGNLILDQLDR